MLYLVHAQGTLGGHRQRIARRFIILTPTTSVRPSLRFSGDNPQNPEVPELRWEITRPRGETL